MIYKWDKSKPPSGDFVLNRDCFQAQGLVAWYPWRGQSSFDAEDRLSGTGQNLTGTAISFLRGQDHEQTASFNGSTSKASASIVLLPAGAPPVSMGAWILPSNTTAGGIACVSQFAGSGVNRYQFDNGVAGQVRWTLVGSAGNGGATVSGLVASKWQHALGVETSSASRYAALDGVSGTVNTTSTTNTGLNTSMIGCISNNSAFSSFWAGQLGEVCFWTRAWTTDEAKIIANPGERYILWYPLRSPRWISFPATSTTTNGVGAAAGTGAATGVGASTAAGVGASAGIGSATAVGTSTAASVGASAGTGTATGVGISTAASVGASAGTGSATGVGASIFSAAGSAAGTGAADGISPGVTAGAGDSAGTGTATGVGAATGAGVGASAGAGTATGIGAATAASVGASAGVGAAAGVGASTVASVGSATGTGSATGIGASIFSAVGSASGTGTATAASPGFTAGVGNAAGTGSTLGIGAAIYAAVGAASGIGGASAVAPSTHVEFDPNELLYVIVPNTDITIFSDAAAL